MRGPYAGQSRTPGTRSSGAWRRPSGLLAERIEALRAEIQVHREREAASAAAQQISEESIGARAGNDFPESEQAGVAGVAGAESATPLSGAAGASQTPPLPPSLDTGDKSGSDFQPVSEELQAVCAERDRLEAERRQAADEAGESRRRLDELEQAMAAAIAEHEEARGSWEVERRELLKRQETLRAELETRSVETARLGTTAAELEAIRGERDRLEAERRQAANDAGESQRRLDELEGALAAAIAEHEEARGSWKAERQELLERQETERRSLLAETERREQEKNDSDRRRDEESRSTLQQETERLRAALEAACKTRDEVMRQADELRAEQDGLRARLDQASAACKDAEHALQIERDRHAAALDLAGQETQTAARRGDALEAKLRELGAESDRGRQERETESQEHGQALLALRQELAAAQTGRDSHEALWRQAEEGREVLRGEAERIRVAHEVLRGEADVIGTERDRLDRELDEARTLLANRSRHAEELEVRVLGLQTALDEERRGRAAEGQEHAKELAALRQDRDAERTRSVERETARQEASDAGERLRKDASQLRADLDIACRLADEHRGQRDRLSTEHKEEASRRDAEHDRLTVLLDKSRREGQAAALRAEALDTQMRALREESDRFRQEREAEVQEQHRKLLATSADRDALRERGAAGEAARADLQRRLADALREQRAALGRVEQLEASVQAARDASPGGLQGSGEPSVTAANASAATHGKVRDAGVPVSELAQQLQVAREANERLRALLAVFGTPSRKIGKDAS